MLVFLDIDGVMVPAIGHRRPEVLADGFVAFSNKSARALDRLITEYDATVVLTTSHKSNYSIEEWEKIFKNRGIHSKKVKSIYPNKDHLSRKEEILNWFSLNNTEEDFVIIDDDKSLNGLPKDLKAHLILTSSYVGLTEEHLNDVKRIVASNKKLPC
ncbi:HAD domain-containing protein [Deminuibacter soli]|uniref:FCP1 homology domain-containing protein n=1 Tax=Deminuibacter soli TaxID=2291815 RepID=A0A3E1NF74_9BACT|nr:HAD domain-containing protein [Deminuibacter soli]RFM26438.1 hypothetical protein DXN05_19605 [Deminuibacter soli]